MKTTLMAIIVAGLGLYESVKHLGEGWMPLVGVIGTCIVLLSCLSFSAVKIAHIKIETS